MSFNNNSFTSKAFRKAIIHKSSKIEVKDFHMKNETEENWLNYKNQTNFRVNLFSKTKNK